MSTMGGAPTGRVGSVQEPGVSDQRDSAPRVHHSDIKVSVADRSVPNFYVVGAQKCGTTSLFEHLKKHPQVFIPFKEPEFFATPPPTGSKEKIWQNREYKTLEAYKSLYVEARKYPAVGDLSPGYLWDSGAVHRIHDACPDAKIIVILRDPVIRAHSAYLMNYGRADDLSPTLTEALKRDAKRNKSHLCGSFFYLEYGLYHEPIRRYIDVFGRDNVLVLLFEDLIRDPLSLLNRVAAHIGIDPEPFASMDLTEAHNTFRTPRFMTAFRIAGALGLRTKLVPSSIRKRLHNTFLFETKNKAPVDDKARETLQRIYAPDIAALEDLLKTALPELRKSWI